MKKIALILLSLFLVGVARADNTSREASVHFQRGVELYGEGDYRGALVEFKKAYAVWPRANVLYDVGQTEFQLLDYASALKTFERYLAETGPAAAHRAEVESTVEVLRGRVGRVQLATDAPDCDVTVDDQPAGVTPLSQPLSVSIGPRKLSVVCPGRPPVTRHLEIAAGETVRLELKLRPPATAQTALRSPSSAPASDAPRVTTKQSLAVWWSMTGILVAATVGLGAATLVEQSHLESLKQSFPVTKDVLDKQANLTLGLSIATDALAALSLAGAAVSTYVTVKYHREHKLRFGIAGASAFVAGKF